MSDALLRAADADEFCPVCKSARYLNKELKFLLEPACYHKMCEACVNRMFSAGPAPCPVVGCGVRLRKARFRTQTFSDIAVEREVDVRRRVLQILNKTKDDFTNPRDWDDYLESIEDITFSIISGTDDEKAAAEKQLTEYEANNKEEIRRNKDKAKLAKHAFDEKKKAEEEAAKRRRELLQKAAQDELAELEERRQAQLQAMESGGESALEKVNKEFEERARKRKEAVEREEEKIKVFREGRDMALSTLADGPNIDEEEFEWIPLGKGVPETSRFYTLDHLDAPRECIIHQSIDTKVASGGYSKAEWFEHSLYAAFSGLTILPDANGQKEVEGMGNSRTDVMIVDGIV